MIERSQRVPGREMKKYNNWNVNNIDFVSNNYTDKQKNKIAYAFNLYEGMGSTPKLSDEEVEYNRSFHASEKVVQNSLKKYLESIHERQNIQIKLYKSYQKMTLKCRKEQAILATNRYIKCLRDYREGSEK